MFTSSQGQKVCGRWNVCAAVIVWAAMFLAACGSELPVASTGIKDDGQANPAMSSAVYECDNSNGKILLFGKGLDHVGLVVHFDGIEGNNTDKTVSLDSMSRSISNAVIRENVIELPATGAAGMYNLYIAASNGAFTRTIKFYQPDSNEVCGEARKPAITSVQAVCDADGSRVFQLRGVNLPSLGSASAGDMLVVQHETDMMTFPLDLPPRGVITLTDSMVSVSVSPMAGSFAFTVEKSSGVSNSLNLDLARGMTTDCESSIGTVTVSDAHLECQEPGVALISITGTGLEPPMGDYSDVVVVFDVFEVEVPFVDFMIIYQGTTFGENGQFSDTHYLVPMGYSGHTLAAKANLSLFHMQGVSNSVVLDMPDLVDLCGDPSAI